MWIMFDPKESDIEEIQLAYGPNLTKFKRGESKQIADPIAARLLVTNPELYSVGSAPVAQPSAPAAAPAASPEA